jgi:hypothetical protein
MADTTEGRMSFVHLEADSQVAILRKQVSLIKAQAVEFVSRIRRAEPWFSYE